jgi:MazG family protein
VAAICDKMTRRHPHVFPDADGNLLSVADSEAQTSAWEEHKRRERAAGGDSDASALAGVSRGLPEWQRALKLQKRASRVGFDWRSPGPVLDKLHEELDEVRHELDAGASAARIADEIGDVLFVGVNLARLTGVDYSQALRGANAKFERRFRRMEALAAADGAPLQEKSLAEQEALLEPGQGRGQGRPTLAAARRLELEASPMTPRRSSIIGRPGQRVGRRVKPFPAPAHLKCPYPQGDCTMRVLFGLILAAVSTTALADHDCKFKAERNPRHRSGRSEGAGARARFQRRAGRRRRRHQAHRVRGKACASEEEWLKDLTVDQERGG